MLKLFYFVCFPQGFVRKAHDKEEYYPDIICINEIPLNDVRHFLSMYKTFEYF